MQAKLVILALTTTIMASPARAEGDAKAGEAAFKKNCAVCHTIEADKNKVGPSLHGIVGRHAAAISNFQYSEAMKKSDKTWDPATLDTYLADPRKTVPNTKMVFAGLKDEKARQDVIAYLEAQK